MIVFIALPIVGILTRTIALNFSSPFQVIDRALVRSFGLSVVTTLVSMGCVILLGLPLAYVLARHQFPLKRGVNLLIEVPVVMPPVVAGLGLLMVFGRKGLLGPLMEVMGISLSFSTAAVVIAQVFVSAPFFIRAAESGFEAIPREVEQAASIDGADRWSMFWSIWLPLSWTHLIKGLALSWARALGEFGATILLAGNLSGRTQTMLLLVYSTLERDLHSALWASLLLIGAALVILAIIQFTAYKHTFLMTARDSEC